jgi:hypothetical protein
MKQNMTQEHLDAVMDALPDELSEGELCALTLTIYSAFLDDPIEVTSELINMIYIYGESRGISRDKISLALRVTADIDDQQQRKQTTH